VSFPHARRLYPPGLPPYDFTKSQQITPDHYYCVSGKVNSADKLYWSSSRSRWTPNTAGVLQLLLLLTARRVTHEVKIYLREKLEIKTACSYATASHGVFRTRRRAEWPTQTGESGSLLNRANKLWQSLLRDSIWRWHLLPFMACFSGRRSPLEGEWSGIWKRDWRCVLYGIYISFYLSVFSCIYGHLHEYEAGFFEGSIIPDQAPSARYPKGQRKVSN